MSEDRDVHTEHCCIKHGCKYGKPDECTVGNGTKTQSYPCEYCREDEEDSTSNTLIEEQAARIAELEADLACEKKESSRLDKAWHNLHDRMVADEASHLEYFDASQVRMRDLFEAEAACQARLSEAVKVLESVASIFDAESYPENGSLESQVGRRVRAFIATLGEEK